MKKRICVATGSRAELGLLLPLIQRIILDDSLILKLAVTGSHLSQTFGETYREIECEAIPIDVKIPILDAADEASCISRACGRALALFGEYFENTVLDAVVILGDRYEMLSVATAALIHRIPIVHIHGGETTQGAIDEAIRHSITKMSYLHFTSCEKYRKRVIQLGEQPDRVFNVGALGVENIKTFKFIEREVLADMLNFSLERPFALITYHPDTLDSRTGQQQFEEVLFALEEFPELNIVFTKANADQGGMEINEAIDQFVAAHPLRVVAYHSLGVHKYLSLMRYCCVLIGNSSSGILEAPSLCIPTVNIGDRQKGRIQAKSIINCEAKRIDISQAICRAMTPAFVKIARTVSSPYEGERTSEKILATMKAHLFDCKVDLKKKFYDIGF